MYLPRKPPPVLAPFVKALWVSHEAPGQPGAQREWVLPTGTVQLVFELPLPSSTNPAGNAVVAGLRAAPRLRDICEPRYTVGAQLWPGAAGLLLGAAADALAERHTPLDALWGAESARAHERLLAARSPAAQLDILEHLLRTRAAQAANMHPVVADALARLAHGTPIAELVRASGYSHRHFVALFQRGVGLTPKLFARVLRFQAVLHALRAAPSLSQLAQSAGYSDQAHLTREFRALSGISPGEYTRHRTPFANHVPLSPPARSDR
jgi:AraC-like DNA-binding protein